MEENEKAPVDLPLAYRLLYPRNVVLVSCIDKSGKANIITLAWSMPVSIDPPMVAIGLTPRRYSYKLIRETGEFVVNIPTMDIVRETLFCGRRTGIEHDKFKEAPLTPLPAKMVGPPIIKECVAHLECKLRREITIGDHTLLIGEVLTAHANRRVFDERFDIKKLKPILHMGGDNFLTVTPEMVTPQLPEDSKRS